MEKEPISNLFQSNVQYESKMDELESILQKISKTLSSLSKSSLGELKSFAKPPALVELSLQCLCILFGRKPTKMPGKADEYWDESKRMLQNAKFLPSLMDFKIDYISNETMIKLKEFFECHPELQTENVKKVSKIAALLDSYVKGIYRCRQLAGEIEPLRNQIQNKVEEEEVKVEMLKAKKFEIEETKNEKITELEITGPNKTDFKKQIQKKIDEKKIILLKNLNDLNTNVIVDLTVQRAFSNPPPMVKLTMQYEPDDYWEISKKILTDPESFVISLKKLDKNDISEKTLMMLEEGFKLNLELNEINIGQISKGAAFIFLLIQNIYDYAKIKGEKDKNIEKKTLAQIPELTAVLNAVNEIRKNDIILLKSCPYPPIPVILTMRLLWSLLQNKIPKKDREFTADEWKSYMKLIPNPFKFADELKNLDINHISDEVIIEVQNLIRENEILIPENVINFSLAAKNVSIFVTEVCKYKELENQKE